MRRRNLLLGDGLAALGVTAGVAQPTRRPIVGYLSSAAAATYPEAYLTAFWQGLGETGYVEGKNVAVEYRWAEDQYERLLASRRTWCSARSM